jgi:signal peptidase II
MHKKNTLKHKFFWRQLAWLWLSAAIIVFDQLTKKVALYCLSGGNIKTALPVLNFSLAFNRGAAFSFLNSAGGWQNVFFIGLAFVFSVAMILWIVRHAHAGQNGCVALIIGGAFGNVVDRFHYGYVIDFIDLHIGIHHWPTFNVADSAICIGVAGLLILNLRTPTT